MIYLIVFLSWLAHLVSKIFDQVKKRKQKFSLKVWFNNPNNYLYVIISALCVITLILSISYEEIPDKVVYGITFKMAYLFSIVIGWLPTSIIRAILNKFKKSK